MTVEDTYLSPIHDDHIRYCKVTLQDMLAYLFMAYGTIQEHNLVQNEIRLMEAWDGSCPFETVITQVDECVTYTAYTGDLPGQILSKTFHIVFHTRLFF
jgi:hypothetical protein